VGKNLVLSREIPVLVEMGEVLSKSY